MPEFTRLYPIVNILKYDCAIHLAWTGTNGLFHYCIMSRHVQNAIMW